MNGAQSLLARAQRLQQSLSAQDTELQLLRLALQTLCRQVGEVKEKARRSGRAKAAGVLELAAELEREAAALLQRRP